MMDKPELATHGYLRNIEQEISINIPDAIQKVILFYFKAIQFIFFETYGKSLKLSKDDDKTINNVGGGWNFAYASWWIDPSILTIIRCKVNKIRCSNSVVIGISSDESGAK